MPRQSFLRALVLGTVIGMLVLGAGGRVAMRVYALLNYQEPYFTPSGSLTVVLIAAAAGAATGVWLWIAARLFASRPAARHLLFWAGLIVLTLRVLDPLSTARVQVFAPLVVLHGVALWFGDRRSSPAARSRLPDPYSRPI